MTELVQKTTPDYGLGLTWFVKDPRFGSIVMHFSLLILSCIFILPIFYVVPLMTGYMVATIRNIQKGKYELPELTSTEQWKDGVMLVLANFALGLIVSLFTGAIALALRFMIGYDSSSDYHMFSSMVGMLVSVINMITNLLLLFAEMLMVVVYAKTGSLNELLIMENYQKVFDNNGLSTIIIVLVLHSVVSSVVSMLGLLLCCIGVLPAAAVIMFITAGLYGQLNTSGVATLVEQEVV